MTNSIFDRTSEKILTLYEEFKNDYAAADKSAQKSIVDALLAEIAEDLVNYIHGRKKPKDVPTNSVWWRVNEQVSKYFTTGSGDPEHYETGAQFVWLLKKIVAQRICVCIRDKARARGYKRANFVSLNAGDANGAPLQVASKDDFIAAVEQREHLDLLRKIFAASQQKSALQRIAQQDATPQDDDLALLTEEQVKLLDLYFMENLTYREIAARFKITESQASSRVKAALKILEQYFQTISDPDAAKTPKKSPKPKKSRNSKNPDDSE